MVIKVSKETCAQPISWFEDEKLIVYLEKKGMKTVGDVVDRQNELSKKMREKVLIKLGYEMFHVRPVKKESSKQ